MQTYCFSGRLWRTYILKIKSFNKHKHGCLVAILDASGLFFNKKLVKGMINLSVKYQSDLRKTALLPDKLTFGSEFVAIWSVFPPMNTRTTCYTLEILVEWYDLPFLSTEKLQLTYSTTYPITYPILQPCYMLPPTPYRLSNPPPLLHANAYLLSYLPPLTCYRLLPICRLIRTVSWDTWMLIPFEMPGPCMWKHVSSMYYTVTV